MMKTSTSRKIDLIEVSPYDDFKIDDPVMVSLNGVYWERGYFAGVNTKGMPTAFDSGSTSWSAFAACNWIYCRRPTQEELGA